MSDKLTVQLKSVLDGMSLAKKLSMIVLLGLTISGFILIMTWVGTPDYKVLFSGMNSEDAGSVISYLQENNIPYKVSSYGNSVLVPEEILNETRIKLASKGLPQGIGVGFEIFDNTKIGMTEFSQNINYQRALQGELSRTINRFDEVENSRVHIVMASKSIFEDTEAPASASVAVKLYPGRKLSPNKVQSIVHMLSSAIPGLKPEKVTVVDNNGNMLTRINDGQSMESSTNDQLAYQAKIESNLESRVKSMLETALGPAKASVRVSCLMDFQKQEKTQEMYMPENRVIRSEQHFNELSGNPEMLPVGIPGVVQNAGQNQEAGLLDVGSRGYEKKDQTINYEIGKVISHIVEPVGKLKRLSIAVLVDGSYHEIEDEAGDKIRQYVPRTPVEMEQLKNIVKSAINFDEQRGDVLEIVNMPFEAGKNDFTISDVSGQGWAAGLQNYSSYLKYVFAIMVIMMTFMFVVRPVITWLTSSNFHGRDLISELPKTLNEIESGTVSPVRQISFQDQANEMFANDQSSVELLRQWLSQSNA
jgi:flagellar M-ring protein FliF